MMQQHNTSLLVLILFLTLVGSTGCGLPQELSQQETQTSITRPQATATTRLSPVPTHSGDLAFSSVALNEKRPMPGQIITATAEVRNIGKASTSAGRLKYYLSRDQLHDSKDKYLNYDNIPALDSGRHSKAIANLRIPEALPNGQYYILMFIDREGYIVENNDRNNVISIQIQVDSNKKPALEIKARREGFDLAFENASVNNQTPSAGEIIKAFCTVRNLGRENSPSTRVRYYLSSDRTFDPSDRYLNYDNIDALASGHASTQQANLRIPHDQLPGQYFIVIVIDPQDDLPESDETNNTLALPISIHLF